MTTLEFRCYKGSCRAAPYMGVSLYDYLLFFSYTFIGGKTYGLVGSPGTGNCALPHILCGNEPDDSVNCGEILVNNTAADISILQANACYAGQAPVTGYKRSGLFRKEPSAAELIKEGLCHTQSRCTFNEVAEIFRLTDYDKPNGRINRPFDWLGIEKWRASLAIGYAWGKRIFAFPLLTYPNFHLVTYCAEAGIFDFLKSNGAVIIVPAVYEKAVSGFADEILFMDDIRETAIAAERRRAEALAYD